MELNDLLFNAFTTDGDGNVALRVVSAGLAADSVDTTHIDWGLTGDQISAEDVPIRDTAGDFDATNVEDALAELVLLIAGGGGAGAPTNATYITQVASAGLDNEQALSALATGIVKNTTTTGVLSIALEGTDYYGPAGTDIPVTDGGTGASDAATARDNLGLEIGADVQGFDATLAALAAFNSNGMITQTAADTFAARTVTGTADKITVTNGDGVAGNPTLTIAATYIGQTSITTLGTIAAGTWQGTAVAVLYGGTGSTTAAGARTALGLEIGVNVQAFDSDLDAFAGIVGTGLVTRTSAGNATVRTMTGTSNRLTVTNGDGVSGNPTFDISTSYVGQSTITTLGTITTGVWTGTAIAVANGGTGSTSAANARTALGVAIGSDVQAYNANLTTWAGKTAPSGTVVGTTDTQTLTNKRITPRIGTEASSGTSTPTADTVDQWNVTALAAADAFAAPTGTPTDGQKLIIRIKDNGTARALTWNAIYRAMGTALPTTTVISKTLYLGFIYNAADSKWDLVASAQEA